MTRRRRAVALIASLALVAALGGRAGAQEPPSATTTTVVAVPSQDIVPQPNSGSAPQEAGDRGGALQLGLLALVVGGVGGAVVVLVRQSRRARA